MEIDTGTMRSKHVSLDGFRRLQTRPTTPQPSQVAAQRQRAYFKPHPMPKEHKFWQKLQLPVLLLAGAMGGFFADNLLLGLTLIAGYALFALIARVPSRTTFTLSLLLLIAISIILLFKPNAALIRNFATYTFALLAVGVVTLMREVKPPKKMRRKYHR